MKKALHFHLSKSDVLLDTQRAFTPKRLDCDTAAILCVCVRQECVCVSVVLRYSLTYATAYSALEEKKAVALRSVTYTEYWIV